MKYCNFVLTLQLSRHAFLTNELVLSSLFFWALWEAWRSTRVCSVCLPAVKQQLSKAHPSSHLVQQVLPVFACPLDLILRTSCSASGQVGQRECRWDAPQRQLHDKHAALGAEEGRPSGDSGGSTADSRSSWRLERSCSPPRIQVDPIEDQGRGDGKL